MWGLIFFFFFCAFSDTPIFSFVQLVWSNRNVVKPIKDGDIKLKRRHGYLEISLWSLLLGWKQHSDILTSSTSSYILRHHKSVRYTMNTTNNQMQTGVDNRPASLVNTINRKQEIWTRHLGFGCFNPLYQTIALRRKINKNIFSLYRPKVGAWMISQIISCFLWSLFNLEQHFSTFYHYWADFLICLLKVLVRSSKLNSLKPG